MNRLDLTDLDVSEIKRVDKLYFGPKLGANLSEVQKLQEKGIELAIDFKNPGESGVDDKKILSDVGIHYVNFPTSDVSQFSFEQLQKMYQLIDKSGGKVLLYCMSGNRAAAIFALMLNEVCGHPWQRSLDIAIKMGLTNLAMQEKVLSRISNR